MASGFREMERRARIKIKLNHAGFIRRILLLIAL